MSEDRAEEQKSSYPRRGMTFTVVVIVLAIFCFLITVLNSLVYLMSLNKIAEMSMDMAGSASCADDGTKWESVDDEILAFAKKHRSILEVVTKNNETMLCFSESVYEIMESF